MSLQASCLPSRRAASDCGACRTTAGHAIARTPHVRGPLAMPRPKESGGVVQRRDEVRDGLRRTADLRVEFRSRLGRLHFVERLAFLLQLRDAIADRDD